MAAPWLLLGSAIGVGTSADAVADEVDDFVTAQMSAQHIPGVSIAVLKGGKPVKIKGYGSANLELDVAATPQTVYKIGSISKQFIAAAILLLNKEGKLGLDDSIRKYLEDAPETWQPITLRHALTHTAGLTREAPGFEPLKVRSDLESIRAAYSTALAFQPGEKFEYSNVGYAVLAEIITRTAQKPWPQYLQERIFAPLGMSATRPTTTEELVPHRASGYSWTEGQYRNAAIILGVRPSGAFLSTVTDLAKWDAALYSDRLLSQQQRELMWTAVKLNDGSEKPYGFGWNLGKVGQHRQVHHAGTLPGFRAQLARFIDDELTVIVLTNSGQSVPETMSLRIAAFYIPDLLPKRQGVELSFNVLDGYTGRYQLSGGRVMKVARREGKLAISMALGQMSIDLGLLTPESATRFFNENDPSSTYVFVADADGRTQLVIENAEGKEVQRSPKLEPAA